MSQVFIVVVEHDNKLNIASGTFYQHLWLGYHSCIEYNYVMFFGEIEYSTIQIWQDFPLLFGYLDRIHQCTLANLYKIRFLDPKLILIPPLHNRPTLISNFIRQFTIGSYSIDPSYSRIPIIRIVKGLTIWCEISRFPIVGSAE